MTKDELIKFLEFHLKDKDNIPDDGCHVGYTRTLKAFEITLAVLKAYEEGCAMSKLEYIKMEGYTTQMWCPVETELDELLKELKQ